MNIDEIFLTDTANEKKIDIVYTFVNPYDNIWMSKYRKYNNNIDHIRFDFGSEQILFSLKTVKKYMGWVNKIFIVSDNQKLHIQDSFLLKKIVYIDHKEIIPKEYLPTFNSYTIEAHIGDIEELGEYFLYLNDDMFFGDNIMYADLFEKNTDKLIQFYTQLRVYNHPWIKNLKITNKMFESLYPGHEYIAPQHAPYFIKKSTFLETKSIFQKFLTEMFIKDKVRTYNDYSHCLLFLYAMYSSYNKIAINKRIKHRSLRKLTEDVIKDIKRQKNKTYCFFRKPRTKEDQRIYELIQETILT